MTTPEGKVKDYLVARIKALGGEVRFAAWVGRKDCPDCRIMLPRKPCWSELKAPGEKPRPSQEREHAKMRALGEIVLVIATKEDVDREFPSA